jgi:hypothetical protein
MLYKWFVLGAAVASRTRVHGLAQECGADPDSELEKNGHFCFGEGITYYNCDAASEFARYHCPKVIDEAAFENCAPNLSNATDTSCCLAPKQKTSLALVSYPRLTIVEGKKYVVFRLNYSVLGHDAPTLQATVDKRVTRFRPYAMEATTCLEDARMVGTFDFFVRANDNSKNDFTIVDMNDATDTRWEGFFKVDDEELEAASTPVTTVRFFDIDKISTHMAQEADSPSQAPSSEQPTHAPTLTVAPSKARSESPSKLATVSPTTPPVVKNQPTGAPSSTNATARGPDSNGDGLVIGESTFIASGILTGVLALFSVGYIVIRNRKIKEPSVDESTTGQVSFNVADENIADISAVDWENAADNPLRESTAATSRRLISSRFFSQLLPQWGDRANLTGSSTRLTSGSVAKNSSKRKRPLAKPIL